MTTRRALGEKPADAGERGDGSRDDGGPQLGGGIQGDAEVPPALRALGAVAFQVRGRAVQVRAEALSQAGQHEPRAERGALEDVQAAERFPDVQLDGGRGRGIRAERAQIGTKAGRFRTRVHVRQVAGELWKVDERGFERLVRRQHHFEERAVVVEIEVGPVEADEALDRFVIASRGNAQLFEDRGHRAFLPSILGAILGFTLFWYVVGMSGDRRWQLRAAAAVGAVAIGACNVILGNHDGSFAPEDASTTVCSPRACEDDACGVTGDGCGGSLDCGTCQLAGFACTEGRCQCETGGCGGRCGFQPDGCQGAGIECGECDATKGLTCGGGDLGRDYCGSGKACVPRACDDDVPGGRLCGKISDGCGHPLDCGNCDDGQKCGAGGLKNQCGCEADTCESRGIVCGPFVDQACPTAPRQCGNCAGEQNCTADGKCIDGCVATAPNVACAGRCGTVELGCDTRVACPGCPPPQVCLGTGVCCTPLTKDIVCAGVECGRHVDNCGQEINCGDCGAGLHACIDGRCKCGTGTGVDSVRCTTGSEVQCCNGAQLCGVAGCCNQNDLSCGGGTSSSGGVD